MHQTCTIGRWKWTTTTTATPDVVTHMRRCAKTRCRHAWRPKLHERVIRGALFDAQHWPCANVLQSTTRMQRANRTTSPFCFFSYLAR